LEEEEEEEEEEQQQQQQQQQEEEGQVGGWSWRLTIISSSWCKSQSCIFLLLKAFCNCTEEGNQSVTTTTHPVKDVHDDDAQPT
jgi:hypothetical protein